MCLRLNNVWSILGSLNKFKKEAHCAAESEHMKTLLRQIEPSEPEDLLDGNNLKYSFRTPHR